MYIIEKVNFRKFANFCTSREICCFSVLFPLLSRLTDLWIGAKSFMGTDSSMWRWTDHTSLVYHNWDPFDIKLFGHACARIVTDFDYMWVDSSCSMHFPYICETDANGRPNQCFTLIKYCKAI